MTALIALLFACGLGEPAAQAEQPDAPAAKTAQPAPEPQGAVHSDGGRIGELDVATLKERIDKGETFVLDVRTPQEFAEGHVPGAVNIPVQELGDRIDELAEYKGKDIDVICRSGSRSTSATKHLRGEGFQRASNVRGGTMAWQAAGYPVEK